MRSFASHGIGGDLSGTEQCHRGPHLAGSKGGGEDEEKEVVVVLGLLEVAEAVLLLCHGCYSYCCPR